MKPGSVLTWAFPLFWRRRGEQQRDGIDQGHRLLARVAMGEAGVGHVLHGQPDAALVPEFVVDLEAGAEFPPRAELGATAGLEIAASDVRLGDPVGSEVMSMPNPAYGA